MKQFLSLLLLAFLLNAVSCNPIDTPFHDHSDKCWFFLQNLTKFNTPAINRSAEENITLLYSGHNLNDLGSYHLCRKLPAQRYSLFEASIFHIGFCGPSYCSTNQLQNYTDEFMKNMSIILRKDLSPYRVIVIDPSISHVEKGFSLFVAVAILGAIAILAVIGTYSANLTKKKTNSKPTSIVEPSQDTLREALLANKETVNEVFSKETAEVYVVKEGEKPVSHIHEKPRTKKATLMKIAECFDLRKNIHDLMNFKVDPSHDPNLNIFNGIRAFAFCYVVLGHTLATFFSSKNYAHLQSFRKSKWVLFLVGGYYAVDTFFYLSGFFTGFLLLSKLKKMPFSFPNYAKIIFHRWIRLWPSYLVTILLFWKIAVFYGDGVMWFGYVQGAQLCATSFWQNLFFIDNLITVKDAGFCAGWGWYLACDFQMFLLAPFVCWIYMKKKSRGLIVIWGLLFLSIVASYYESLNTGMTYILDPHMDGATEDYFEGYYTNSIVRLSPYILGLLLGLKFREYKNGDKNWFTDVKNKKVNGALLSLAGFALIFFIIAYPRTQQTGEKWSNGFGITWSAFSRPMFGLGIFLLTVPGLVGNLPSLRFFLSNSYFTLVSRLSYTGYLLHYIIMLLVAYDTDQVSGFLEWYQTRLTFGICILSCIAAAMMHIFIEKPFTNIEMKFFNQKPPALKAKADK